MAENRQGAGADPADCHAARPLAGAAPDLPGPRKPLAVARPQPGGGRRIDVAQCGVQGLWSMLREQPPRLIARGRVGFGYVGDPAGE